MIPSQTLFYIACSCSTWAEMWVILCFADRAREVVVGGDCCLSLELKSSFGHLLSMELHVPQITVLGKILLPNLTRQ